MPKATLERVLEEVQALAPADRNRLREALDGMDGSAGEDRKRLALREALRDAGLVTQVRQPRPKGIPNRRLVQVHGKPVSETIIEERR